LLGHLRVEEGKTLVNGGPRHERDRAGWEIVKSSGNCWRRPSNKGQRRRKVAGQGKKINGASLKKRQTVGRKEFSPLFTLKGGGWTLDERYRLGDDGDGQSRGRLWEDVPYETMPKKRIAPRGQEETLCEKKRGNANRLGTLRAQGGKGKSLMEGKGCHFGKIRGRRGP